MSEILGRVRDILALGGVTEAATEASAIVRAAGTDSDRAIQMAERRAKGTPLAYVIERQIFMGVELFVAPGALVPREETELLGKTAVELARGMNAKRVIDMCCGAGNLACGIATQLPEAHVWGSDLTDGCVSVARRNVDKLKLGGRVEIHQGDLFASLGDKGLEGSIDVVVCNPPYISTGKLGKERAELLDHEPREAFDGGPYGLSIHQRVIKDALPYLVPGGWLLFEIGLGQDRQLKALFDRARVYEEVDTRADAAGSPRVVLARKKRES